MKNLILCLLLLLSLNVRGQQARIHKFGDSEENSRGTIKLYQDSLLMVCGIGYSFAFNGTSQRGFLNLLDKNLNVLKTYSSDSLWGNISYNVGVVNGSDVTCFGFVEEKASMIRHANSEISELYSYGGWDENFYEAAKIGKCYYAFGRTSSYTHESDSLNRRDIYVCKFSSNGNLLWQKNYGTALRDYIYGMTINGDSSGILLTGKSRFNHDLTYMDSSQWLFVCIDTNGFVLWQKNYNLPMYMNERINEVVPSDDEGYYFTGNVTYPGSTVPLDFSVFANYMVLGKINSMGDTVWIKRFWDHTLASDNPKNKRWNQATANSLIRLKNGDLLLTGHWYNDDGLDNEQQPFYDAFVSRYSIDGDSIWRYDYTSSKDDYFEAALEDTWGYIYVCGSSMVENNSDSYNPSQVLVVKLDANGCVIDTCLMPEPTEEPIIPFNHLFPNPFSSILNIQFYQQDFIDQQIQCNVYNSVGQLVKKLNWTATSQNISVDTNDWSNGFYIIELKGNNQIQRVKAIKQ